MAYSQIARPVYFHLFGRRALSQPNALLSTGEQDRLYSGVASNYALIPENAATFPHGTNFNMCVQQKT